MLQCSSRLLSIKAKKLLYYGQIHSHLCYGIGVWGPMLTVGQLTQLYTIQRKCVKLIDNTKCVSDVFKKLRMLTVKDLTELEQSKLGYKLCKGMLPDVLTRLMLCDFNKNTMVKKHSYPTRQKEYSKQT